MNGMSGQQVFALAFGAVYLTVGVAGFVLTGFADFATNSSEALLIFEVNPFHNLIHVGVGAMALMAARAVPPSGTTGILLGIGLVYLLSAALGFAGYLEALSIDGFYAADNFLHLVTAVVLLAFARVDLLLRDEAVA